MDPADIIDELQRLERGLDWLAYEICVPVEQLASWIYGGTPMPQDVQEHIRKTLVAEDRGDPGRAAKNELVVIVRVPADKLPLLERAAAMQARARRQSVPLATYLLGTAVDVAAMDLSLRDDGSAWDYEQ